MAKDLEGIRADAAAMLVEARAALELAWSRGDGDDPFLKGCRANIVPNLERLEREIKAVTSESELWSIHRQIKLYWNKRAYWFDAPQVQANADAAIREILTWGIPARYYEENLRPLQESVRSALAEAVVTDDSTKYTAALRKAQTTLEAIFAEYQYWDWYTEKYVSGILKPIVIVLGILGSGSLLAALILAVHYHENLLAMFLAGLAGTCVSIILKQEPLAVYGENVKSLIWTVGRLLTGAIATVIGMGLLASGFINVGFTAADDNKDRLVPLHVLVRGCIKQKCPSPPSDERTVAADREGGAVDAGGGAGRGATAAAGRGGSGGTTGAAATADGGTSSRRDGGSTARGRADASATSTPAAGDECKDKDCDPCCPTGALLAMLGLAMLFGFSERAFAKILAQFEDKVGGGTATAPAARPSITPVPPPTAAQSAAKSQTAGSARAEPPDPPASPSPAAPPDPPKQPTGRASPPAPPKDPPPNS